ncbi:hypothetical protein N7G274_000833 [Stereocaulon virgatum]|uniref:F-box domain-containing protein n=1 Tax=Stereocaulon virgatum TaxID=373712 RepID=A0ABR4ANL5_9LECA
MPFKEFPADLAVLLVSEYISPDDIEAFSLTCRGMHDLAKYRLRKHKELKAAYGTISLDTYNVESGIEISDNVYRCCSDAWTRCYPRHMIITSYNVAQTDASPGCVSDRIASMARYSAFATPEEVRDWDLQTWDVQDAAAALCLGLFPNIQHIEFVRNHEPWSEALWELTGTVIDRVMASREDQEGPQALTKLKKISARSQESLIRSLMDLRWFRYFSAVPTVKVFEVDNIRALVNNEHINMDAPRVSNITRVSVKTSLISAKIFSEFFTQIRSLRTFEYTSVPCLQCAYEPDVLGESNEHNYHMIINALTEHAGDTLRTLKLSSSCYSCATPMESLQSFNSLKHVALSASMLPRKGAALMNLAKILPATVAYMKIEGPFAHTHQRSHMSDKDHQNQLLTFLPDIGKQFGALRYQTLGLVKGERAVGPNKPDRKTRYTLHPGPGVLQSLKPDERLEWVECGGE